MTPFSTLVLLLLMLLGFTFYHLSLPMIPTMTAVSSFSMSLKSSNLRKQNISAESVPKTESILGVASNANTSTTTNTTTPTTTTTTTTTASFLTCNEIPLKVPTTLQCNTQSGSSTTAPTTTTTTITSVNSKLNVFDENPIVFDSDTNPLYINFSPSTPTQAKAASTYANKLMNDIDGGCDLWDNYIEVLGLNGLHQPMLETNNNKLHMLGGWAAGHARSKGIDIRHVIEILASAASAGAALHGVVWTHLVEWRSTKEKKQPTHTNLDEKLWEYALKHVCFMANTHPQLYVHCLHAFGHAALVLSVFKADPVLGTAISYHCPMYPEISNVIAQEVETSAVRMCEHAKRYQFISTVNRRREQEAFICADGVYMLYFEQRIVSESADTKGIAGSSSMDADLRLKWWAPCGKSSYFAAPCFEFLFRTGTAGRRIAGLKPLVPRSRHAAPPPLKEQRTAHAHVFPTLCLRSESRIRTSANPKFLTPTQNFLACVHAISEHLFEANFPLRGIGFLDRCNSRSTEKAVQNSMAQRDAPWVEYPGSPLEPIFSFCAQTALNIGFDKLLALTLTADAGSFIETKHDTQLRIQRIQRISQALVAKPTWSEKNLATWKACVAGIGTSASFYTAVQYVPCWAVKWTLCRDSIPRYDGVKKSHLETVAPEMVNTCIRLALSRSQRRKVDANGGIDVGGDIGVIWDVASLGFR